MMDHEELMAIMTDRMDRHLQQLHETWRAMLKNDPESDFMDGYGDAYEKITRAMELDGNYVEIDEYQCGYYYACLVILGADTTGLRR